MKEGDVYRWYFKNDTEYRAKNQSTAYWCMDNQCVVNSFGELMDTYWDGVKASYFSSNSKVVDTDKADLEFVCNVNDVKFIGKWEVGDYDKVYNLSHQKGCYPLFAVDRDATVSNKALRIKYQNLVDQAIANKRSAEYDIEYYTKLINELGE